MFYFNINLLVWKRNNINSRRNSLWENREEIQRNSGFSYWQEKYLFCSKDLEYLEDIIDSIYERDIS